MKTKEVIRESIRQINLQEPKTEEAKEFRRGMVLALEWVLQDNHVTMMLYSYV